MLRNMLCAFAFALVILANAVMLLEPEAVIARVFAGLAVAAIIALIAVQETGKGSNP